MQVRIQRKDTTGYTHRNKALVPLPLLFSLRFPRVTKLSLNAFIEYMHKLAFPNIMQQAQLQSLN
jgi:hypothetical protein